MLYCVDKYVDMCLDSLWATRFLRSVTVIKIEFSTAYS